MRALGGTESRLKRYRRTRVRTLGIIGGIAPESTVDYYRRIVAAFRQQRSDGSYPQIMINSIDMTKMLNLISAGRLPEVTDYLLGELFKLSKAGADLGVLASNTPHLVFDDLQRQSPIPLLSIVEATREAARAKGLRKLGLFGTGFTMRGSFYPEVFSRSGITVVVPNAEEQDYIHASYIGELVEGVYRDETRERMLAIAKRLKEQEAIQGLILGGTELPMLFRDGAHSDIPLLDTTAIHV